MDKLVRIVTAPTVAAIAAIISYRHAYELISSHGETGVTARLVPFTVDGLLLATSMLILDANRRNKPVPPPARWYLSTGIVATICANLAHGLGHGPIGALVSAWPALAIAGSFELLMTMIRKDHESSGKQPDTRVSFLHSIASASRCCHAESAAGRTLPCRQCNSNVMIVPICMSPRR
jgi:Protein of unknown function (DUF2637)